MTPITIINPIAIPTPIPIIRGLIGVLSDLLAGSTLSTEPCVVVKFDTDDAVVFLESLSDFLSEDAASCVVNTVETLFDGIYTCFVVFKTGTFVVCFAVVVDKIAAVDVFTVDCLVFLFVGLFLLVVVGNAFVVVVVGFIVVTTKYVLGFRVDDVVTVVGFEVIFVILFVLVVMVVVVSFVVEADVVETVVSLVVGIVCLIVVFFIVVSGFVITSFDVIDSEVMPVVDCLTGEVVI